MLAELVIPKIEDWPDVGELPVIDTLVAGLDCMSGAEDDPKAEDAATVVDEKLIGTELVLDPRACECDPLSEIVPDGSCCEWLPLIDEP